MATPEIIHAEDAGTLDGLFRERVRRTPSALAYRSYNRQQQQWQDTSWAEAGTAVARWQAALARENLHPGERVALMVKNSKAWVFFEQAALGLGLVVVPLYIDDRPDNVAYILNDAGVKVLFLQDHLQWNALQPHQAELHKIQRFVLQKAKADSSLSRDPRLVLLDDWLPAAGASTLHERGGDPHALATIVYTSGTTGRPKGVMLSHWNILTVAEGSLEVLNVFDSHHLWLSFLPLSHTFERTCGYYCPMLCGAGIAFARSVQQLAEDIQNQKPTVFVAVPRVYERIYERLQQQLHKKGLLARALFNLTVRIGWRRFHIKQKEAHWGPDQLLWPLLYRLVAGQVLEKFGGRLDIAVSGGAALPLAVARVFIGLGLNLVQGYGMTESAPVVCVNPGKRNRPASVGQPLPGVEVRLGEHDELEVKSPGVMLGYWNNHQATSEAITPDGWLRTGDKARIDADNYVYITGRIKDILVMSNGEKIPPADMEQAIALDPLFDQALVIGEGKPFLSVLVVLNGEQWFSLSQRHGLDPQDSKSLRDKRLRGAVQKKIAQCLHDFPGYAKVRRVIPLLEPWSLENNLMTPTMKIKRQKVIDKFQHDIEQLYQ